MIEINPHIGLYYPYIHFRDDVWVKLAALYWDKMARIVPRGYMTHDSDVVRQLAQEGKFIVDEPAQFHSVGWYDSNFNLDETFTIFLKQNENALRDHYGVAQKDKWPDDPVTRTACPPGADPKLAYIYIEKMSPDLQEAFVNTGLAEADYHIDEQGDSIEVGRVGMHPKLASVYMAALAEEMAKHLPGYYPVADETLNHLTVSGWTLERLAQALLKNVRLSDQVRSEQEIEATLAIIALRFVIPRDIASVPTEKILALHRDYAAERVAFQTYLRKIVTELGEEVLRSGSQRAIQAYLGAVYETQLFPQLQDLEKRLRGLNIDTAISTMTTSFVVPPAISSVEKLPAITATDPLVPFVAAGGAIALGMLKIVRDTQRLRGEEEKKTPSASYLLHTKKKLQPTDLMSRISRLVRKFGIFTKSRH